MRFAKDRPPGRPPEPVPANDAAPSPVRMAAHYEYQDEHGTTLFRSVRMEPKRFFQQRPHPYGGWISDLEGVRLVLYRLPELLATPATEMVYLCEGEKDVDRLRELGLVATCNPMGAGSWRDEFSAFLAGRPVVILPDNDKAGRDHADKVRKSVEPLAASVMALPLPGLPDQGDVSDWLDAGGTREDLERLVAAPVVAVPRLVYLTAADLLLGAPVPVPWLISTPPDERGNVRGGLLAERETAIIGAASGTGKTWLMAEIIRALSLGDPLFGWFTVARPCRIMLIDEESSVWLLRQRWAMLLRGHGIDAEKYAREVFEDRVRIYVDQGFSYDDDRALEALYEEAHGFKPDVLLHDTLARIHRRPENDNSQIAALFEDRIKPFKREIGCALAFAHHVRKATKDAPNDPASLLRGASDLKGQLDEFWFLRGRTGEPKAIFEHDKCRAMPEIPSFVLARETTDDGGIRLVHAGEAMAASAATAEMNNEVILRFLIDNGQQSREQVCEFGKSRGMSERTVDRTLKALVESDEADQAKLGKQRVYWACEVD